MLGLDLGEIDAFRFAAIEKAERVGLETVAFDVDEFGQNSANAINGQAGEWIAGIAHDTKAAVLCDGAGRPSKTAMRS